MNNKIRVFFEKVLDVIYPQVTCYCCGEELFDTEENLCDDCKSNLQELEEKEKKFDDISVFSYCRYGGLARDIILQAKDSDKPYLAKVIAKYIASAYYSSGKEADVIAYVPSTKRNYYRRGYDNMFNVARFLSKELDIPISNGLLRKKDNPDQTDVEHANRYSNVKDSFTYSGTSVTDKRVLLIDDVVTTSATLTACKKALFFGQPKEIICCTFSRAELKR